MQYLFASKAMLTNRSSDGRSSSVVAQSWVGLMLVSKSNNDNCALHLRRIEGPHEIAKLLSSVG